MNLENGHTIALLNESFIDSALENLHTFVTERQVETLEMLRHQAAEHDRIMGRTTTTAPSTTVASERVEKKDKGKGKAAAVAINAERPKQVKRRNAEAGPSRQPASKPTVTDSSGQAGDERLTARKETSRMTAPTSLPRMIRAVDPIPRAPAVQKAHIAGAAPVITKKKTGPATRTSAKDPPSPAVTRKPPQSSALKKPSAAAAVKTRASTSKVTNKAQPAGSRTTTPDSSEDRATTPSFADIAANDDDSVTVIRNPDYPSEPEGDDKDDEHGTKFKNPCDGCILAEEDCYVVAGASVCWRCKRYKYKCTHAKVKQEGKRKKRKSAAVVEDSDREEGPSSESCVHSSGL